MATTLCVYELPCPLSLTSSCFGERFDIRLGGWSGILTLPSLAIAAGSAPRVVAPPIRHLPVSRGSGMRVGTWHAREGFDWGAVTSWDGNTGEPHDAWLGSVAVELAMPGEYLTDEGTASELGAAGGAAINGLFDAVDDWFDNLCSWVAVSVGQDTHYREPVASVTVAGSGLTVATVLDDGRVSRSRSANLASVVLETTPAVGLATLGRILAELNDGRTPTEARLILRDGHVEVRRGRLRKAVIDGGTAAEVALAQWCTSHSVHLETDKPTLGTYVRRAGAPVPPASQTDLVDVRNDAIHNNTVPTLKQAVVALRVATQILDAVDPLAF